MPSFQSFIISQKTQSTLKLDLPPLVSDVKRSIHDSTRAINALPAFLEPQPQTMMEQQHHDKILLPRLHRLSLSSLSSNSSDQSLDDELLSPPQLLFDGGDTPSLKSHEHQGMYRIQFPLPTNYSIQIHNSTSKRPLLHQETLLSPSSSPVPSSQSTFWTASTPIHNDQQHEFVTKNSHIKRPRNAWIHFRCYFGQSLKAKEPTIRAEEISKHASECWARLTSKQKKPWHIMAEQEKLAHQEAFPFYRYRPKRALPKSVVLTCPDQCSNSTNSNNNSKKFRLALD